MVSVKVRKYFIIGRLQLVVGKGKPMDEDSQFCVFGSDGLLEFFDDRYMVDYPDDISWPPSYLKLMSCE